MKRLWPLSVLIAAIIITDQMIKGFHLSPSFDSEKVPGMDMVQWAILVLVSLGMLISLYGLVKKRNAAVIEPTGHALFFAGAFSCFLDLLQGGHIHQQKLYLNLALFCLIIGIILLVFNFLKGKFS